MATGEIEVLTDEIVILNPAKTPPIPIGQKKAVDEAMRLKYRYIDLRREQMQRNMLIRHKAIKFIRDFLDETRRAAALEGAAGAEVVAGVEAAAKRLEESARETREPAWR